MQEISAPILISTTLVVCLSALILGVRRWLIPSGTATITVNEHHTIEAAIGDSLLWSLASNSILLPAACGGRGSCGQCRVTVLSGGDELLNTEAAHISRSDAKSGRRLACMVKVRGDMRIQMPAAMLDSRRWTGKVHDNRRLSPHLTELTIALDGEQSLEFQAGDYILFEAPPGQTRFADLAAGKPYQQEWQQQGLDELIVTRDTVEVRAYSLANAPSDKHVVTLIVRLALPPPGASKDTPPGEVSSYLFSLRKGDPVTLSGPFGEFHVREGDCEMILIGGGVGIAPLRSILLDQLRDKRTKRRISFWYGVRNATELSYEAEFELLARQFPNFSWDVAYSSPSSNDPGTPGHNGFIHTVLFNEYLDSHVAPESLDYYLCGPPLMSEAVVMMLEDLGVEKEHIFFDDFAA